MRIQILLISKTLHHFITLAWLEIQKMQEYYLTPDQTFCCRITYVVFKNIIYQHISLIIYFIIIYIFQIHTNLFQQYGDSPIHTATRYDREKILLNLLALRYVLVPRRRKRLEAKSGKSFILNIVPSTFNHMLDVFNHKKLFHFWN